MKNLKFKRVLSFLLAFTLIFSLLPVGALAAELDGEPVCTHVHDEYCGYVDAADCLHVHDEICGYIEGADCTHECGEDCADDCIHTEHDEDCGYIEAMPCIHTEHDDCGYADAAPCTHVHDTDCGYSESADRTHMCAEDEPEEPEQPGINAAAVGIVPAAAEVETYAYTIDLYDTNGEWNDTIGNPSLYDVTNDKPLENVTITDITDRYKRIEFTSQDDRVTVELSDSGFGGTVWGAFNTGDANAVVVTAEYNHAYLSGGLAATYYLTADAADEKITCTVIQSQDTGIEFFFKNGVTGASKKVGVDYTTNEQMESSSPLLPEGASSGTKYLVSLDVTDNLTKSGLFTYGAEIFFKVRSQPTDSSWLTAFGSYNTDITYSDSGKAGASFTLPPQTIPEEGTYTYTVDIFNYDPVSVPILIDESHGNVPINVKRQGFRTQKFLRMTFTSDDDDLSLKLTNSSTNAGAFGDGRFKLTPEYSHVYLVGSTTTTTNATSVNPSNPAITYYMSATVDKKIKLTAIKRQSTGLQFAYSADGAAGVILAIESNTSALTSELLPLNATAGDLQVFTRTSDESFATGASIMFTARTAFGSSSTAQALFSSSTGSLSASSQKNAQFTMPSTHTPSTSWYNTTDTTFNLTTADQLVGLAELVNDGTDSFDGKTITFAELTENISLFPYEWTPIGTSSKPFKGTFDGGGHIFSGLDINSSGNVPLKDYLGLFGYISGATITRVGVEVFGIVGKDNVGGIVGYADDNSTITNCYVTYYPSSNLPYAISGENNVGGIAGTMIGSIENCYNTADIDGTNSVGGIAGYATEWVDNRIFACYNTGYVDGNREIGGIAGKVSDTDVINCYNTGDIGNMSTSQNFGSIWGMKSGDSSTTYNYRYKFAKILAAPWTDESDTTYDNNPSSYHGGIKRASALWSKAEYEANGWLFADSTPTTGPWVWDTAYTYPKLGFGAESYPFDFYFDANPHEQAASTNRTITVIPHNKVTSVQWATATGVTPPSSGFANISGNTVTMPVGINYLHLKGSFDGSTVSGAFGTYSVLAVPITSSAVTVTTPVTGGAKSTATSVPNGANYTSSTVTWTPIDNKFLRNTIYTATVTLTASEGYTFTDLTTATINGNAATVSNNTGGTMTLSYAFPRTGNATVVGIAVSTQPTKLTYTAGDTLDLSGIVVDIIYNDDLYDSILLANFSTKSITASPAHGAALTPSHNGTAVTVSHGGFSATTSSLTVNVGTLSGTPTITIGGGQLEFGATLTVGTSGLNTQSGLTYQWKADNVAISGATNSTYTVTTAELGKEITVTVTASGNYTGSVTSATTPPVPYKVIVGGYSNNGDTVTAQTAYRGTGDTVTINYTLTSGAFINTLSLGHGITITTTGSQTYSYTVNASHATNGTITLTPVFTHESTLSGIDVAVNEPSTGAVPQATVSSLASYYDSSTVTWSPAVTGGKFLGSTVYTATVTLYVNAGNATFASTFAAKVNGYDATVTMIVQPTLFASGYITFTYTFPATDARVVSSIAVTTQPTKTEYYSGEKLDLSGLVVTATYNDGTTGQVIPTGYAIDGKAVTPGTTLLTTAHNNNPVTVTFDGETAVTGNLTVKLPPTIHNIKVTDITSSGATISYNTTTGTVAITSNVLEYKKGNGAWQSAANGTPITGLLPNTVYDYRITVSDGTKAVTSSGKFQTAPQVSSGVTVSGTVLDSSTPSSIVVTIERGNTAVASVTVSGSGTYNFSFTDIPNGVYNLVADNGKYKVTQAVTVTNIDIAAIQINMDSGKTQSVVDIVSDDTPPAAVEGLPDLFNTAVYTSDDQYFVNNEGGMVEIKLAVEKQNAPSEAGVINTAAGSTQEIGLFLDISVIKSLYTSVGELTHEEKLPDLGASNLLTITFELPSSMSGKTITAIYRAHGAGVDTLTKTSSPEKFEQNGNIITLYVYKFSTYALAIAKETDDGSGGTGGSSGSGGSGGKSGGSGGGIIIEAETPAMKSTIIKGFDDKNVKAGTLGQYASYTVEITAEQAKKITTAVVTMSNGTERQVPTYVYQESGKWYVKVCSLTDSAFALIYNERTFSDVKGKWYESAVNEMASRKIIEGVGNDIFAGEREMTRAEFAVIIIRALGLPENGNGTVFGDVSASAWYAGAVGKAYEYGIVSGVGNGMFAPDRKITRQEAMAAIQHAAKTAGFNGSSGSIGAFTDADSVSSWALEAVRWNVGSGLVSGSDGKLNPVSNITRAETAALVLKLLQKAGLVDTRTSLITAPMSKAAAVITVEPRKEPDPIQVTEDNDEETTKPEDDGNVPDVSDDTDSGTAVAERMTPQEAITTLNNLLAMCGAVTRG